MIHVFKTSVNSENQIQGLKPYLDKLFPLSKWTFDLEDPEKIFRIESTDNVSLLINFLFKVFDFDCEELE